MSGVKAKEYTLERNPSGDYEKFIRRVSKAFIENFSYDIDCRITPKNKKKAWMINEKKLLKVKNILIKTLQEEIAKEDLRAITSETNQALKKLNELVDNAKDDLKYINDEVYKKVNEEL